MMECKEPLPNADQANPVKKGLAACDEGLSAILTALMLPVLVGFVGLGVDVGMWYAKKRALQSAADSASISAALTYAARHDLTSARGFAVGDAERNGFDSATGTTTINIPPLSGTNMADPGAAEVILKEPQRLFFTSLFIREAVVVRTRAVASASALPGSHCIVALDPAMDRAVDFSGTANATIDCGVASNSVSNSSIYIGGSGSLTADPVDTAGDILISGSAELNTVTPPRLGGTVPDPYAYLEIPASPAACITAAALPAGVTVRRGGVSTSANNLTLVPGRYCGGLTLTNAENTTFAPGVYIIDGGDFKVSGTSSMHGSGVTFILTGSGASYAQVDFAGGTDVQFSAPTSGPYAGILFFQDPHAPSYRGATLLQNSILGGTRSDFTGVMYFPSQEVRFTGGAVTTSNRCLHLVARKVTVTGNAHLGSQCGGTGVNPISRVVVKLVE